MSRSDNKPKTYPVGHGRPPKEYCFKPGQSGNPLGKRKQSESTTVWGKLRELIIQEAYRRVRVREGDKTIVLPAIQAALRANLMSAVQGNKKAFTASMSLVSAVESRNEEIQLQNFAAALDYKLNMKREIARREREGIIAPAPIPHPDDIVVNARTGEVTIRGPLDEGEKAILEDAKRRRLELKLSLKEFEELLNSTRNKARVEAISSVIGRIKAQIKRLTEFIDDNDSHRNRVD